MNLSAENYFSQWHFQTKFSGLCSSKIVDLVLPVCRLRYNAQDLQLKWSHGMSVIQSMLIITLVGTRDLGTL